MKPREGSISRSRYAWIILLILGMITAGCQGVIAQEIWEGEASLSSWDEEEVLSDSDDLGFTDGFVGQASYEEWSGEEEVLWESEEEGEILVYDGQEVEEELEEAGASEERIATLVTPDWEEDYASFEEAWNDAVHAAKDYEEISVLMHTDWVSDEEGIFGSGEGFSLEGSIILDVPGSIINLEANGYSVERRGEAAEGGCVFCIFDGTLVIWDGLITGGNSATDGGGALVLGGILDLENVQVTGNVAEAGGGLCVKGGEAYLCDCEITGNTASSYGGGLYIDTDQAEVFYFEGVLIEGNVSGEGGDVYEAGENTSLFELESLEEAEEAEETEEVEKAEEGEEESIEESDFVGGLRQTVEISGEILWEGDQESQRPECVIIRLLADGVITASQEVKPSKEGKWLYCFQNLSRYREVDGEEKKEQGEEAEGEQGEESEGEEGSEEIVYSITAEAIEGYSTKISSYDVIQTCLAKEADLKGIYLSGKILWEDEEDEEGKRPGSVVVNLFAKNTFLGQVSVKENSSGSWTFDFGRVDSLGETAGTGPYVLTEDVIEGYTAVIAMTKQKRDEEGTQYFVTITNTLSMALRGEDSQKQVSCLLIEGEILWKDEENQGGTRPEEVVVRLYQGETSLQEVTVKPDEEGRWLYSFEAVPVYAEEETEVTQDGEERELRLSYEIAPEEIEGYEWSLSIESQEAEGETLEVQTKVTEVLDALLEKDEGGHSEGGHREGGRRGEEQEESGDGEKEEKELTPTPTLTSAPRQTHTPTPSPTLTPTQTPTPTPTSAQTPTPTPTTKPSRSSSSSSGSSSGSSHSSSSSSDSDSDDSDSDDSDSDDSSSSSSSGRSSSSSSSSGSSSSGSSSSRSSSSSSGSSSGSSRSSSSDSDSEEDDSDSDSSSSSSGRSSSSSSSSGNSSKSSSSSSGDSSSSKSKSSSEEEESTEEGEEESVAVTHSARKSASSSSTSTAQSVQTGDPSKTGFFVTLLALSLVGILYVAAGKRRKK